MLAVITGYAASVLLAVSLLMTNDIRFRWFNMMGCLAFIIYGFLIVAFPIILTNVILFLINVLYLFRAYNAKEKFELLEFAPGDQIVQRFFDFYNKDIKNYFPDFDPALVKDSNLRFVVLRDMVIANVFAARLDESGDALVEINYTVPKYRDFKVGKFIFQKEKHFLLSRGVRRMVYAAVANKHHGAFLRRMGFVKQGAQTVKLLQ